MLTIRHIAHTVITNLNVIHVFFLKKRSTANNMMALLACFVVYPLLLWIGSETAAIVLATRIVDGNRLDSLLHEYNRKDIIIEHHIHWSG